MNDWSGWDEAEAEVFLDDEATPQVYSQGTDGEGNTEETWTPGNPVPFLLTEDEDPVERTVGGRVEAVYTFAGYVPLGTAITSQDRIEHAGRTYQVLGHDSGRTGAALLKLHLARLGEGS